MNEAETSFNYFELNELKIKYGELEKDIRRLRIENTKKEKEIQKLREDLQNYRKSSNDSSTNYPWSDEFVERWKKLVENTIMDSFDNIFYKNILLVRVINITVRIVYDMADEKIKEKIKEILICFGCEKNNSDDDIKIFFHKFKSIIFQDYFKTIIKVNDELLNTILLNIKLEINKLKEKFFTDEEIIEIEKDLDSKNIIPFIKELFTLSLYMIIHDPQLTISTSLDLRYCYFSKKQIILDGFGKEDSVCLIILTPPLIKYSYFKKLLPIAFICDNPSENIIKECQDKRLNEIKNEQSKSFCSKFNEANFFHNNIENKISITNINSPNGKKEMNCNIQNYQSLNTNTASTISTTTYTSNRNNNIIERIIDKDIIKVSEDNYYKTPIEMSNKKKEYIRSKSSSKQNPYLIKNQEKIMLRQMEKSKRNNTINENDLKINIFNKNNLNNLVFQASNKKKENYSFNITSKISINNNQKKDKSIVILHEEQKQLDNSLKKIKENYLLSKSKQSLNKIDKSRNNSTYDIENENHSKEKIETYPIKLVTEVPLNQNKTPMLKNRTNSINSFGDSSQNNISPINTIIADHSKKINSINAIICNNQKKVKTTIRKINNNSNVNIYTNNTISNLNNLHLRKTASTNIEPSHMIYAQNNYSNTSNNNNSNSNIININHKNSHSHIDKKNKNISYKNFDSSSYRNSTRDIIRNNSHSNDNNSHNMSSNSICSNNSNRNKNKGMKNNFSNNFLVSKNNNIGKLDCKNNIIINNNQNKNILRKNSKKGYDYYNTQPIKTDFNLVSEGIKLQENSTISSNRMSNTNSIKNSYFITNDIKSMGKIFKNDVKKRSKALLGKKMDIQMNYEYNQYQNTRINSPPVKNKNKFNNNINHKINNLNSGNKDFGLNKKNNSGSINHFDRQKNKK